MTVKAVTNEDKLLPMMFVRLRKLRSICCGHKMFLNKIRNIFCQKHFVSTANVCQFAQPKKHHGQQCVRNNSVLSFARAFSMVPIFFKVKLFSFNCVAVKGEI